MRPLLCFFLILASSLDPSTGKELPSWFLTCKESEDVLFSCLRKLFDTLKPQLPNGIETLNIPPIEPLVIPIVLMEEERENTTYKAKIRDLKMHGISNYEVKSISLNVKEGLMKLTLWMPNIKLIGNFEVKGKYLDKPVDGFGKFVTDFTDFSAFVAVEAEIIQENGDQRFRMEDTQVTIDMYRAKGYLTNTYRGEDKTFEWTNKFLKACALDMVREVRPAVEMIIGMLIGEIGNKIPTFTPYTLLFPRT